MNTATLWEMILYDFLPMLSIAQLERITTFLELEQRHRPFPVTALGYSEELIRQLIEQGGDEGDTIYLISLLVWRRRAGILLEDHRVDAEEIWDAALYNDLKFIHRFLVEDGDGRVPHYRGEYSTRTYEEDMARRLSEFETSGILFEESGHDDHLTILFRTLNILGPKAKSYPWFQSARAFLENFVERVVSGAPLRTSVSDTEFALAVLDLQYSWDLARPALEFLMRESRMSGGAESFPAWVLGWRAFGTDFLEVVHESVGVDVSLLNDVLSAVD